MTHSTKQLFVSYSRSDADLRERLAKLLEPLRRDGIITLWHDQKISPGEDWKKAIDMRLAQADVIVLLVTPDFLASDYCSEIEMTKALERWSARHAQIIPIIARDCLWDHSPLARMQVVLHKGKAVTSAINQDEAWTDVARSIYRVAALPDSDITIVRTSASGVRQPRQATHWKRLALWGPPLAATLAVAATAFIYERTRPPQATRDTASISSMSNSAQLAIPPLTMDEFSVRFMKSNAVTILWKPTESEISSQDLAQRGIDLFSLEAGIRDLCVALGGWEPSHCEPRSLGPGVSADGSPRPPIQGIVYYLFKNGAPVDPQDLIVGLYYNPQRENVRFVYQGPRSQQARESALSRARLNLRNALTALGNIVGALHRGRASMGFGDVASPYASDWWDGADVIARVIKE